MHDNFEGPPTNAKPSTTTIASGLVVVREQIETKEARLRAFFTTVLVVKDVFDMVKIDTGWIFHFVCGLTGRENEASRNCGRLDWFGQEQQITDVVNSNYL